MLHIALCSAPPSPSFSLLRVREESDAARPFDRRDASALFLNGFVASGEMGRVGCRVYYYRAAAVLHSVGVAAGFKSYDTDGKGASRSTFSQN